MFTKNTFKSKKYDTKIWIFLDFLHFEIDPEFVGNAYTRGGIVTNLATNHGIIAFSNHPSHDNYEYFSKLKDNWQHHVICLDLTNSNPDYRFSIGAQKTKAGGYIDNLLITSAHGPSTINHDGYNFIYKGF